ncbi:hypothetical protein [Sagittula sp. SSi028]|uniref:hypothetical protein n=1 Tax=Sagittula sp. SSi028 TaxID=3400636 RepID=UPI003AF53655
MAKRKIRIVRCKCNYDLAFGAHTCPYCFRKTPLHNRYWFWALIGAIGLLGGTAILPSLLGAELAMAGQ